MLCKYEINNGSSPRKEFLIEGATKMLRECAGVENVESTYVFKLAMLYYIEMLSTIV